VIVRRDVYGSLITLSRAVATSATGTVVTASWSALARMNGPMGLSPTEVRRGQRGVLEDDAEVLAGAAGAGAAWYSSTSSTPASRVRMTQASRVARHSTPTKRLQSAGRSSK
jgi:hypothetical protein